MRLEELLNKFNDCDSFELCAYANVKKRISMDDAEKEKANMEKIIKQKIKSEYDRDHRWMIEPFEAFYEDILNDVESGEYDKRGEFKYKKPIKLLATAYSKIFLLEQSIEIINARTNANNSTNPLDIFKDDSYKDLKDSLISCDLTNHTHCTEGPDFFVYRFKLDDNSRGWLLKKDDQFHFNSNELADLALYSNNKLRYSSCTHELMENEIND